MQLVERHLIKKTHKYWQECDALCFKAKNLYNLCNYYMRQRFWEMGKVWSNTKLYHLVVSSDAYHSFIIREGITAKVLLLEKSYSNYGSDLYPPTA